MFLQQTLMMLTVFDVKCSIEFMKINTDVTADLEYYLANRFIYLTSK